MENSIRTALTDALAALGVSPVAFAVEHSDDPAHGEYASNVALVSAKATGESPRTFAEKLCEELQKKQIPFVETIEIAGPGFINFHLSRDFFAKQIAEVLEKKDD